MAASANRMENESIIVSSQVSYIGKEGLLFNPSETIYGNTNVVLQYLQKGYLWRTIRN